MGYANKNWVQTQFENFSKRIAAVFARKSDIPTSLPASNTTSDYSAVGTDPVNGVAVSKALQTQQAAIDGAYQQATGYTDQAIANLINGAPSTLDTLGEIAAAMQESADVVDALEAAIGTKASQAELDGHISNNTIHITASERQTWNGKQTMTGDTKDNTVTFTSGDAANPTAWTDVPILASGEKHNSILNKISTMFKNVRYLWKLMGNTSLSGIGDGTVTGAISALNTRISVNSSNTSGNPKHSYIENDGLIFTMGKLAIFDLNTGLSAAFPVMQTVPIIYGLPAAAYTQFAVFYSNGNPVRVCADEQGILSIYLPHTDVVGELAGNIVYFTK